MKMQVMFVGDLFDSFTKRDKVDLIWKKTMETLSVGIIKKFESA